MIVAMFGGNEAGKANSPTFDAPPSPVPSDDALKMKQQGLSDTQITQGLQAKGYSPQQISDALRQASLHVPQYQQVPSQPSGDFAPSPPSIDQLQSHPNDLSSGPVVPGEGYSLADERIEEIAEAIIDEKWQEMVKDVRKVIEWKDTVESKVGHLEQQIKDVRLSMENMQKAIFGKISDYDKSITDVGTEIKAMEKVFQKVLPALTESVNKLERMTKSKK